MKGERPVKEGGLQFASFTVILGGVDKVVEISNFDLIRDMDAIVKLKEVCVDFL
jgi:hypothetical protein